MSDVACFCGWVYSFSGDLGVCPKCSEYAPINRLAIEEEQPTRREADADSHTRARKVARDLMLSRVRHEPAQAQGARGGPAMNKLTHKRLVDRLMQAYVTWRGACLRVSEAYAFWGAAGGPDATSAFAVYTAALDQEERAAEVYAELIRSTGHVVAGSGETDSLRLGSHAACGASR